MDSRTEASEGAPAGEKTKDSEELEGIESVKGVKAVKAVKGVKKASGVSNPKRVKGVRELLRRASALADGLLDAPENSKTIQKLRRALRRAEREATLEAERMVVERSALREAMLDDLVLRHAHCLAVLDRHRVICDSKDAAEGSSGANAWAGGLSAFDRAIASRNAIEAALRELRPNVPPAAAPDTVKLLQSR